MFELACDDIMPGCAVRFENPDKDALLAVVADHAVTVHGMTELTPDVVAAVDINTAFVA